MYKDNSKDATKDKGSKSEDKKSRDEAASPVNVLETVLGENEDELSQLDSEDENVTNVLEDEVNCSGTDEDISHDQTNDKNYLNDQYNQIDQNQEEQEVKGSQSSSANKVVLEAFLNSLLSCVNRDSIDKAVVNFCTNLNTKYNRKKLVRALFIVPRTRLDLLPFYSRMVASLAVIMPHVASDLVQLLKQDFKFHIRVKDQINIESKIKNVRFIGELVKFKIFPNSEALHCLKVQLIIN